jgi:hypothetical protein
MVEIRHMRIIESNVPVFTDAEEAKVRRFRLNCIPNLKRISGQRSEKGFRHRNIDLSHTHTFRATPSALRPASNCFSAPIICASVCLLFDVLPSFFLPRKSYSPSGGIALAAQTVISGRLRSCHPVARNVLIKTSDPPMIIGRVSRSCRTIDAITTPKKGIM